MLSFISLCSIETFHTVAMVLGSIHARDLLGMNYCANSMLKMGCTVLNGHILPCYLSTVAWTKKFSDGLCTHFLQLRGLNSSRNSSLLINRQCEWTFRRWTWECFWKRLNTWFLQLKLWHCHIRLSLPESHDSINNWCDTFSCTMVYDIYAIQQVNYLMNMVVILPDVSDICPAISF